MSAESAKIDSRVVDPKGETLEKIDVNAQQYWVDAQGVKHLYGTQVAIAKGVAGTDQATVAGPSTVDHVVDQVKTTVRDVSNTELGRYIEYGAVAAGAVLLISWMLSHGSRRVKQIRSDHA